MNDENETPLDPLEITILELIKPTSVEENGEDYYKVEIDHSNVLVNTVPDIRGTVNIYYVYFFV